MNFFDETDIDELLEEAGEEGVIDDGTPSGYPVRGLFSGPSKSQELFPGDPTVATYAPAYAVKASDVEASGARTGTKITLSGKIYYIAKPPETERPDSKGMAILTLSEDPI